MDNNKIVDNLNFIKIYFRVFIYKIIVAKKTWIIQKRDKKKILEYGLKTHLSVRPGSRKPKKESKMHPNTKVRSTPTSTIRHFWNANWHFQCAEWHPFELWPNSLQVPIKHIIFDFFHRKTHPDSNSTCRCLFFKHSSLYK